MDKFIGTLFWGNCFFFSHIFAGGSQYQPVPVSESRQFQQTRGTYFCGDFPAKPLGRGQRAVHLSFAVSVLGVAQLEGVCGQRVLGSDRMVFTHVRHDVRKSRAGVNACLCVVVVGAGAGGGHGNPPNNSSFWSPFQINTQRLKKKERNTNFEFHFAIPFLLCCFQ